MSGLENIIPTQRLVERKRSNFTKSLDLGEVNSIDCGNASYDRFSQSIHIVSHETQNHSNHGNAKSVSDSNGNTLKSSVKKYFPWFRGREASLVSTKSIKEHEIQTKGNRNERANQQLCSSGSLGNYTQENVNQNGGQCKCSKFHHHTFKNGTFYLPREATANQGMSFSSRMEFIEANRRHMTVCNTFWKPELSLNQQNYANRQVCCKYLIDFDSLWPEEGSLKSLLKDGIQNTALRDAISELALLAVVCGPVHLLEYMINLSLIRLDCHLEDGQGLLHYACLMQRPSLIGCLTKMGILPELPDRRGYTADEVCFCPNIWRNLPNRYHANTTICPSTETLIMPTLHDKSVLFRMAQMTGNIYEIQMNLQTLNFNVNTECNTNGDFLIHVAVMGGLCQLPLILTLVRIQKADIELCNSKGMTPLMITAQAGDRMLCDVLICVLGADPNKVNVNNGRSALHYAALNCHEDCVSCLIKRGADLNHEDYIGCLPEDLLCTDNNMSDSHCREIIQIHRKQRLYQLEDVIINGEINVNDLVQSDLCCVSDDGFTLVMLAAVSNRINNLKKLLSLDLKSIDAQFGQTTKEYYIGMTAMAMAAKLGLANVVYFLLSKGSNPAIPDINGDLPLHQAVTQNHSKVVEVILGFFPTGFTGFQRAKELCSCPELEKKLEVAWQRRQDEIVSPALLEHTMKGNADKLYCLLEPGDSVDIQSAFGSWPLYLAIQNDYIQIVQLLCERQADLSKRHSQSGNSVLHLAASLGRLEITEYLVNCCALQFGSSVSYGRNTKFSGTSLDVNGINGSGKTALQLAAEKGFLRVVRCLLNHGATTSLLAPTGILFAVPEYEGVWSEILSHRQKHTDLIMDLIETNTKQSLNKLTDVWMPGFDHNLRDHHGNTPLMNACRVANVEFVLFLLQSAVYTNTYDQDEVYLESCSDSESGVLDTDSIKLDQAEGDCQNLVSQDTPINTRLENLLQDVRRPIGLSIYHDGLVNHVCAVNLTDKSTSMHCCLLRGDNLEVLELLLKVDPNESTINTRNSSGLTPLHLGCQLNRRKCVQKLVDQVGIDLDIRTLDGRLPEEMTNNKHIIKIIQRKKQNFSVRSSSVLRSRSSSITTVVTDTQQVHSDVQTTINFDKVATRFQAMKQKIGGKRSINQK